MMIRLTIIFLFMSCAGTFANDISKINALKKSAETAYKAGQFETAAADYSYLIDTLHIEDDQAIMNLGHTYYQLGQKDLAQAQYQKLVLSQNENLKSIAYQQLGALSKDPKTLEKALFYFKESIKSDPSNKDARYNYEMVKKKLKEQQDQNQDQQNQDENQDQENKDQENKDQEQQNQDQKDQENQDQQEQDQQEQNSEDQQQDQQNQDQQGDQEEKEQEGQENEQKDGEQQEQEQSQQENGEEGEEKDNKQQQTPSPSDKMKEMNISEEKAKMILEALKNSEVQYIQQNRRKPTKRKDSDKPDW